MNRFKACAVLFILIAVSVCGCHRDFRPNPEMCFYRDVYDISDNVRGVGVKESKDGQMRIGVDIYADYFEYDYEEFCDRVVEVAEEYDLNENGSYQVTIYDLNSSLQDQDSAGAEYTGNYFGEYSKVYD